MFELSAKTSFLSSALPIDRLRKALLCFITLLALPVSEAVATPYSYETGKPWQGDLPSPPPPAWDHDYQSCLKALPDMFIYAHAVCQSNCGFFSGIFGKKREYGIQRLGSFGHIRAKRICDIYHIEAANGSDRAKAHARCLSDKLAIDAHRGCSSKKCYLSEFDEMINSRIPGGSSLEYLDHNDTKLDRIAIDTVDEVMGQCEDYANSIDVIYN